MLPGRDWCPICETAHGDVSWERYLRGKRVIQAFLASASVRTRAQMARNLGRCFDPVGWLRMASDADLRSLQNVGVVMLADIRRVLASDALLSHLSRMSAVRLGGM